MSMGTDVYGTIDVYAYSSCLCVQWMSMGTIDVYGTIDV